MDAERRGFDFEVSSDHNFPWLCAQGHSPEMTHLEPLECRAFSNGVALVRYGTPSLTRGGH